MEKGDSIFKYGNQTLHAYFAKPKENKKYPGIILIHEIWGLNAHIRNIADRLSEAGYCVLAPDLFADTPIKDMLTPDLAKEAFNPKTRDQAQPKLRALFAPLNSPEFGKDMIKKLKSCFSYLKENPVCNGNIAVLGFCFGGTYSYALATEEPGIKAAVSFYGSGPQPVAKAQSISCPVLAFYGEKDERLIAQLPSLKKAMADYGKDLKSVVYPECGHAFFNDTNPNTYNKKAATDAWKKTLSFLRMNLRNNLKLPDQKMP